MAAGEYELALPVALDAVQQGQALFKPAPALQLFPLYLLAAQANLGLRRSKQCEDFLALASWLAMKVRIIGTEGLQQDHPEPNACPAGAPTDNQHHEISAQQTLRTAVCFPGT